jgi:hypothetical protein
LGLHALESTDEAISAPLSCQSQCSPSKATQTVETKLTHNKTTQLRSQLLHNTTLSGGAPNAVSAITLADTAAMS